MKFTLKKFGLLFFVTALMFSTMACRGGIKCGPLEDALTDADSDCIANGSDNCPLVYNPSQADGDEDEVGAACDIDDDDASEGSVLSDDNILASTTELGFAPATYPKETTQPKTLYSYQASECLYYIIGSNNQFLGTLEDSMSPLSLYNSDSNYGNPDSLDSLFHFANPFGRPLSNFSAYDPFAHYPPALFCSLQNQEQFIGYITTNPEQILGIHPDEVFHN